MIRKRAFLVLAVGVLMGTMAFVASANYMGANSHGPADASLSADPERGIGQLVDVEIREPVETGAVPDPSGSSSEFGSGTVGDEPTMEIGGQSYRPSVDVGP